MLVRKKIHGFLFFISFLSSLIAFSFEVPLNNSWYIKKTSEVSLKGDALTSSLPDIKSWYKISLPSTVMNCLEKHKVYSDIFMGTNFDSISKEQFKQPWWYLSTFNLPEKFHGKFIRLKFEGINYRANIWLNGNLVASSDTLFGAFSVFKIDITNTVAATKNILAVEVFPPQPGDLTMGFVDWNPEPPDRNMGIWRPVTLLASDVVSISNVFVRSKVDVTKSPKATLFVEARLTNHSKEKQSVLLRCLVAGKEISQKVSLKPLERKLVSYKQLVINSPKLWWPNGLGDPYQYELTMKCYLGKKISDSTNCLFGIKEAADYFTKEGFRGFKINGREVMIKGAGWRDNLFLNEDSSDFETKIRYVHHMNLNTIRVEGIGGNSEYLYDLCDKYGILVMAGFSCQWEWPHYLQKDFKDPEKHGGIITSEEMDLAVRYMKDQLRWLRTHPSLFAWLPGSDLNPHPELERRYMFTLKKIFPGLPYISSAADKPSKVSGPTGFKMRGPYDYVTPVYWFADTTRGGGFGFSTESGPGPQLPVMETIRKMIPEDSLWPLDNSAWKFHYGRRSFHNMDIYTNALNQRYGKATGIEDYIRKAQLMNYEAMRPSFEAYRSNKPKSTGYIHWMLNNASPGTYWQLYDYYLLPNAAYYATRKACNPLNLIYNYETKDVSLVNDTHKSYKKLKAVRLVYSSASALLHADTVSCDIHENGVKKVFKSLNVTDVNHLYFVLVKLLDSSNALVSDNFYWLSDQEDILSTIEGKLWYVTLNDQLANLTYIQQLAKAEVTYDVKKKSVKGGEVEFELVLKNNSPVIAFFMEMNFKDKTGAIVKPVYWEENYLSLLPGETRIIKAMVAKEFSEDIKFSLEGINVK